MVELNCKRAVVRGCSGDGGEARGGGTVGYLGYDLVWTMDGFKEGCRLVVDGGLNWPGHMHIVCCSVVKAERVQVVNYCVMVKRRSAFAGFTIYRSSSSFPWRLDLSLGAVAMSRHLLH